MAKEECTDARERPLMINHKREKKKSKSPSNGAKEKRIKIITA